MAVNQTAGTNADDIVLESAKIEYSKDSGSVWNDLGLADNVVVTFTSVKREVQPGNGTAPDRVKGSSTQTATLAADMWQLSNQNLADITGGLLEYYSVAGTSSNETQVWAADSTEADNFYAFDTQQADATTPTSIVLTSDPDGTPVTLTLNTDYRIVKISDSWGWIPISGVAYNATKVISAAYTVTPAVETGYTVGGTSSQASYWYRVTNYVPTESGITYNLYNQWIFYKGIQEGDLATALKNKDDTDPAARIPLTIGFSLDPDRTEGDQLYKFRRYQESKT